MSDRYRVYCRLCHYKGIKIRNILQLKIYILSKITYEKFKLKNKCKQERNLIKMESMRNEKKNCDRRKW